MLRNENVIVKNMKIKAMRDDAVCNPSNQHSKARGLKGSEDQFR